MQIKDYYVIPENEMDERFITEEMSFLIDVSVRNRDKFKTFEEYAKTVINKYDSWATKEVSYG